MRKSIELKGAGAEKLNVEYFEKLLREDYGIQGDFTLAYEQGDKGTGTVTITGEGLDMSDIYTVLARKFKLTAFTSWTSLEDRLKGGAQ